MEDEDDNNVGEDDVCSCSLYELCQTVRIEDTAIHQHACAASDSHCIVALACTDVLVFRLIDSHNRALVRHLPWFKESSKAVSAWCFDPSAEWLAIVCVDNSVVLLPVLHLLAPDWRPSTTIPDVSLDDATLIGPLKSLPATPIACGWWTNEDKEHVLLISFKNGTLAFIDAATGNHRMSLTLRLPVTVIEVIRGRGFSNALLQQGLDYVQLKLEFLSEEIGGTGLTFDSILKSPRKAAFAPATLTLETKAHIRQAHRRRGTVLSVHSGDLLKVYNLDLQGRPLFVYQLPPRATNILLTDLLLFSTSQTESPTLTITSCLLASHAAGAPTMSYTERKEIIQELVMPAGLQIFGTFNGPLKAPADSSGSDDGERLPTVVVITNQGIFECRPNQNPADVFMRKLHEHSSAVGLGKTLRLDVIALYRQGAQHAFARGEYKYALKLFRLGQTPPLQIVRSFVAARCMDMVRSYIEQQFRNANSLQSSVLKKLSNLFFYYLVHEERTIMSAAIKSGSHFETKKKADSNRQWETLSDFMRDWWHYDDGMASVVLLHCGLLDAFFELCIMRHKLPQALKMPINHGLPALSRAARERLTDEGFSGAVCDCQNGLILHCIRPEEAARLLASKADSLKRCLDHVPPLLRELDVPTLVHLAMFLDPSRATVQSVIPTLRRRRRSTSSVKSLEEEEMEVSEFYLEDVIELFFAVLSALRYARQRENVDLSHIAAHYPWLSDPRDCVAHAFPAKPSDQRTDAASGSGVSPLLDLRLSSGKQHSAFVLKEQLYTWGVPKKGRLGQGEITEVEETFSPPTRIETLRINNAQVFSVSCGEEHTIARCSNGVYAWGSNSYGQLGCGDENVKYSAHPRIVRDLSARTVLAVAAGSFHSMALAKDSVWSWGWGVYGQLGLGRTGNFHEPMRVTALDNMVVVQIAAGFMHSAALTVEGLVYGFGSNMNGQLGLPISQKYSEPTLIKELEREAVRLVVCGRQQTFMLTCKDSLFVSGLWPEVSKSGREDSAAVRVPKRLALPFAPVQIAAGSRHALFLSDTGVVVSWGFGCREPTAASAEPSVLSRLQLMGLRIKAVSAGDDFSVLLDSEDNLWTFGQNENGQLGFLGKAPISSPMKLALNPAREADMSLLSDGGAAGGGGGVAGDGSNMRADIPAMPEFANFPVEYGGWTASLALQALRGLYRVSEVLSNCRAWQDHNSEAQLYLMLGDFLRSFDIRIRGATAVLRRKHASASEELLSRLGQFVLQLAAAYFAFGDRKSEFQERARASVGPILLHALTLWDRHGLPIDLLEGFLRAKIHVLLPHVVRLLTESEAESEPARRILARLSSETLTDILMRYTQQVKSVGASDASPAGNISEDRLWAEVFQNLTKDLHSRSKTSVTHVRKPAGDAGGSSGGNSSGGGGSSGGSGPAVGGGVGSGRFADGQLDTVVFTCGHDYNRQYFQDKILPDLRAQLMGVPLKRPLLYSILLDCYSQQTQFSLACPVCVFAAIRRKCSAEFPGAKVTAWEPRSF
eukprot:m.206486 g.206486  ORF g.206486 m.206486 type:complete len:1512 (+) comp17775_c1_seq2:139-4674(+)